MTTIQHSTLALPDGPIENMDVVKTGKTSNVPARSTRAALGDVVNNIPVTRSQVNAKKDLISKPIRTLTKQKATVSLPQAPTQAITTRRAAKKSVEDVVPEPMEVVGEDSNDVEMSDAFSVDLIAAGVEDIDKDDTNNPQLVVDYVNQIYAYLRHLERVQNVRENYLSHTSGVILPKMRAVLIDWLVDVHQQFNLLQETLYLTVAIIDRFLQEAADSINRKMLQLVGVTAMFLASKYEEMYAPEIGDFVYITDNAYTASQIRNMEMKILRTLDFEMGRPLPLHFLRRNSKTGFVDARIHTLAKYVMELSIIEYKMAHIPPSMLAAAALAFSLRVLDPDVENSKGSEYWTTTLAHYSSYKFDEIAPLIKDLAKLVKKVTNAPQDAKLMAVRKKYGDKKGMRIAKIPELKSSTAEALAEGIFH